MINVTLDYGGIPVLWVRFNPDGYVDSKNKKNRNNIKNRMPFLIETLQKLETYEPKSLCSVLYLYYDGFATNNIIIEDIDLSLINY